MSRHGGCGCGHAHAQPETVQETVQETVPGGHGDQGHGHEGHGHEGHSHDDHGHAGGQMESMEGGCGDGCGCGHSAGGLAQVEVAALRGFLSGIYASRLDATQLAEYLEQMGSDENSEFAQPARFLGSTLAQLGEAGMLPTDTPAAFTLLDAVAGEDGDDEDGDDEDLESDEGSPEGAESADGEVLRQ